MGSYARKVKRNSIEKEKGPRCCGRHMFMNKYGLWQCKKCGRQKFNTGAAPVVEPEVITQEVTTNDEIQATNITDSSLVEVEEVKDEK